MSSSIDICNLIPDLWGSIRDNVPEKRKEETLTLMLNTLIEHGIIEDVSDLSELVGSMDDHLDHVIEQMQDGLIEDDDEEVFYND